MIYRRTRHETTPIPAGHSAIVLKTMLPLGGNTVDEDEDDLIEFKRVRLISRLSGNPDSGASGMPRSLPRHQQQHLSSAPRPAGIHPIVPRFFIPSNEPLYGFGNNPPEGDTRQRFLGLRASYFESEVERVYYELVREVKAGEVVFREDPSGNGGLKKFEEVMVKLDEGLNWNSTF